MKRLFDFIVALCALLTLLPVIIVVAALICFKLGSPILFTQNRPGLNGDILKLSFALRSSTGIPPKNMALE